MHDAILTAMDKILVPRVEITMRPITSLTGRGPYSDLQNPERRDFLRNASNTPLMSASCRLDLNTNQDKNDETRNEENFEDGDCPALGLNCDQRAYAHHKDQKLKFFVLNYNLS